MTTPDTKSGGEMAEQRRGKQYGKTDARYWERKLFHDGYTRNGSRVLCPEWSVRLQHGGRREAFSLGSSNKANAATKARDIYLCLRGNGWEEAVSRFKPREAKASETHATIGQLISEIEGIASIRPKTLADYAKSLRLITASIFKIDGGVKKFDPHKGGRDQWLKEVEAIQIAELTPERIQKWKLSFIKKAGEDPLKQKSAKISANSLMRQAKSLFSKKITRFLTISLPTPLPFDGVEFEPRQSMRFRSSVRIREVIEAARAELGSGDSSQREQYKIFLLSLCAGLRRNEIDKLEWTAFDFESHGVNVAPSEFFDPKTQTSCGTIDLEPEVSAIFKEFQKTAKSRFVIESPRAPRMNAKYSTYRCQPLFDKLIKWLREKGIKSKKPIHEMRKEYGSMITNEHGIFAASRALRHADVAITNQHYAEQRKRVTISLAQ